MYEYFNWEQELKNAENGDLDAMFNVASYIMYGDRTHKPEPELTERAIRYYKANINVGDCDSMLDLGGVYLGGHGIARDESQAVHYYQMAADRMYPKAFRCLGNFYRYDNITGIGSVPTGDEARLRLALKYYEKGAELYEQNCLYELGDYYLEGLFVDQDKDKAFRLYMEAFDVIDSDVDDDCYSDVCLRLGEGYHHGYGVDIDPQKSLYYLEIAKDECKRRLENGDLYGGVYLPRAQKEFQEVFQALN